MDSTWARVLDFLLEVFPQSKQSQFPSACFAICSSMASSKAGRIELSSHGRFISQFRFRKREGLACVVSVCAFSLLFWSLWRFRRYRRRCQLCQHALLQCGSSRLPCLHFHNDSPHNTTSPWLDPGPFYSRSSCPKLQKQQKRFNLVQWYSMTGLCAPS